MGKTQGDEWNELIVLLQSERYQIWEQGAQSVMNERISQYPVIGKVRSTRILRTYFLKRANSVVVGSLVKVFQIESLERGSGKMHIYALTYPTVFETPFGKHSSVGGNLACVAHNTSNTESSKLLQQHARLTAVAFHSGAVSL